MDIHTVVHNAHIFLKMYIMLILLYTIKEMINIH